MKTIACYNQDRWAFGYTLRAISLFIGILLIMFCMKSTAYAKKNPPDISTSTTGSGKMYKTTVQRHTEKELSDEDFHQISTLGSHIVRYLNTAVEDVEGMNSKRAKEDIKKALTLAGIVRQMLPVTTVTTWVKDAKENEVYRDTERVQNEQIPIYNFMIETDVIDPLITVKHRKLSVKGVRLDESEMVYTTVLLNLGVVEKKLRRAAKLVDTKPNDALEVLTSAQDNSIRIITREEQNALFEAQRALLLAERMVSEKNYAAARADLNVARLFLETYTETSKGSKDKDLESMLEEIDQLSNKIDQNGIILKIRKSWHRITKKISGRFRQIHQPIED